jgi:adenylate cyclase
MRPPPRSWPLRRRLPPRGRVCHDRGVMAHTDVTVERRFHAPRELVWALLCDTNRLDRAVGLAAPSYTWREIDGVRRLVGTARQAGLTMTWIERPYEWVEGSYFRGGRDFLSGPAAAGGVELDVDLAGEGSCKARVSIWGDPKSLLLRTVQPIVRAGMRRRMKAYVEAVAALAEVPRETAEPSHDGDAPPVSVARELFMGSEAAVVSGRRSAIDDAELARRRARLEQAPVAREIVEHIVHTLASRPDDEVAQMNPFALAHLWGVSRRETLRAFLYATQAGLVDLNWQVNCPVCRVSAQVVGSLVDVSDKVHCDACNIRYDVDFGANVEAVFRCNRALRDVVPAVFCVASPAFRPHVLAQLRVDPGAPVTKSLVLSDGPLHVRTLGPQRAADVPIDVLPARLVVHVEGDAVRAHAEGEVPPGTPTELQLHADTPETYVLVERGGWSSDAVLGSVIASLPEFVDLFATEAPAAGRELSIGNLTVLFSDLTGSTALYERVGDARAFAIVQEHFDAMTEAIERHEGAIVKTMGDAVMATFRSPLRAVQAAITMVDVAERHHGDLGIGVKLGIHEGPCLAVRANDRLDFFGTTVNVAARLQGQAGQGRLVIVAELLEDPAIAAALSGRTWRRYRANLKGLTQDRELASVDLRAEPAPAATGSDSA